MLYKKTILPSATSVSTQDGFKNNQYEFASVPSSLEAAALLMTHSLAKYKSFKAQTQQSI